MGFTFMISVVGVYSGFEIDSVLLAVPSMCAWVVSSSGASEASGAIMRGAMKAFAMKK